MLQTCKLVKFGNQTTCDKASFMKTIILINILPQFYDTEICKIEKQIILYVGKINVSYIIRFLLKV